jgi:uncharacterized membrane protein YccC
LQRLAEDIAASVRSGIAVLEMQCRDLGPLIDKLDWDGLTKLLSEMARARHAFTNAWAASEGRRTPEFENEIATRVRRVLDYREWQLKRLERLRDDTSGRLQLVSRWKSYARSVAGRRDPNQSSRIFSDIR